MPVRNDSVICWLLSCLLSLQRSDEGMQFVLVCQLLLRVHRQDVGEADSLAWLAHPADTVAQLSKRPLIGRRLGKYKCETSKTATAVKSTREYGCVISSNQVVVIAILNI